MALSDAMIGMLNPWWTDPRWAESDPHLQALESRSVVLPPPSFVDGIELGDRSTHVVRGPRQVGKSTGLKLLSRRLMAELGVDPRRIIYLDLDLLEDQPIQEATASVIRAKQLAAPDREPCLLLLDEVTTVSKWARAVKAAWDAGLTRADTLVCTGSSAIDLAEGELESLPGRRGAGLDYLVLPQSFAAFARAIDARIPSSPGLTIAAMLSEEGRRALERHQAYVPGLNDALDRYITFGGLPAAVAEAAEGARSPSAEVKRVVWDSVSREVRKRGASEPALRALLERVVRSLGHKTSWPTVAREMDTALGGKKVPPDPRSVRAYIEFLGRCYEVMTVYFWKTGSDTNDLSRDKKLYLGDPLLQTVVLDRSPGLARDKPATVENALAIALYRRYESPARQADGFNDPDGIHVYETSAPREIDFVCGPWRNAELLEVKFKRGAGFADTQSMRKAFPRRNGLVASIDAFELGEQFAIIPAALALWALG